MPSLSAGGVSLWCGGIGRVGRREMQKGRDMGTYVYV